MLRTASRSAMPSAMLWLALLGALVALLGGFWDDTWHTVRGRDTFFSPPHVAIYGGVSFLGAVIGAWLVLLTRRLSLRSALSRPSTMLALVALGATLASGPIDNVWHALFGRDAVIWSPPHLLGIVGTFALGGALLVETRGRRTAGVACGALLIAAATFAVAEYETDVPQFSEAFYLPVLTVGALLAFTLIDLVAASRWAASRAAVAHGGFAAVVALFLAALEYPTPAAPVVIGAAVAFDLSRGRPVVLRALLVTAGLVVAVSTRRALGSALSLDAGELVTGAAMSFAVGALLLALLDWRPRRTSAIAVATFALLLVPAVAMAHDPGQGEDAGAARLDLSAQGRQVDLRGRLRPCRAVRSGRLVARRAGKTVSAPLEVDGCEFSGRAGVSEFGRWFVYADLQTAKGPVESWLPIEVGDGTARASAADRFAYTPADRPSSVAKLVASGVLLLLAVGLLTATVLIARRATAARTT